MLNQKAYNREVGAFFVSFACILFKCPIFNEIRKRFAMNIRTNQAIFISENAQRANNIIVITGNNTGAIL